MKETQGKPKVVVSTIHGEVGGVLGANSASELPRNRRQVYNQQASARKSDKVDPIFELVQQCKADLMPGGRRFVRSVNFDTSPSCVLATDLLLNDVVRFCTTPGELCVFGIDPTFNLGKFYVTVTTFAYTHVVNKSTGKSPTFLGPIFVHTEQTSESYYTFFSTLLKLEPKLANIVAVGTDGEKAIVKALKAVFPEKIYLRCFLHMKDNIRRKLSELLLPESVREDIIKDLFGTQQGSTYVKGALDASSCADFDDRLLRLKIKWDEAEAAFHPNHEPQVYNWILKNEAEVMRHSMLAPVRELAGLGSPPVSFTTNRNESMNSVVKAFANHRQSSWVQLADNMFHLVRNQKEEIGKAVLQMGEYQFKPSYKSLEVPSSKWFSMSSEQRQKHLIKVHAMKSKPVESTHASIPSHGIISLSIPPEESGISTISGVLLERTWKKAEKLLNTDGSICAAPGMSDAMCVASDTGSRPHIVTTTKKGSLACDESCIAWKSQKFCSHVLAVAEKQDCLVEFLNDYRRSKVKGNYTAVSTHGQAKSVSKKPGSKRKGPQSTKVAVEDYIDPFPGSSSSTTPVSDQVDDQVDVAKPNLPDAHCSELQPSSCSSMSQLIHSIANRNCQFNIVPTSGTASLDCSQVLATQSQSQLQPAAGVKSCSPFEIKFLTPAIKVCAGCRQGFARASDGKSCLPPPFDLCLVRKEQHFYYNVVNSKHQWSRVTNVHYHANSSCPRLRFSDFNPSSVQVPKDIVPKLTPEHWLFLLQAFGIVS